MDQTDRRKAPRREVHLPVIGRTVFEPFEAVLANISLSGALLEQVSSTLPPTGSFTKVELLPSERKTPIELTGIVVRQTEDGFAVQFLSIPEELRKLMDESDWRAGTPVH